MHSSPKAQTRIWVILPKQLSNNKTIKGLTKNLKTAAKLRQSFCEAVVELSTVTNLSSIVSSPPPSATATISTIFVLTSSTARVTSIKSSKQEWINQWLTNKARQWLGPITSTIQPICEQHVPGLFLFSDLFIPKHSWYILVTTGCGVLFSSPCTF